MTFKKILWPTDLSENAKRALPLVASLSEKYGAEVHILYVMEDLGSFGAWYGDFDLSQIQRMQEMDRQKGEESLDQICKSHLEGCPLYVRHTAKGDPASEILKLAETEKPDVVILATKGRKGRFELGSVAEKVVRHSKVPVLTIPL
jgi:nucleotide-binding universal stress UspA family protein